MNLIKNSIILLTFSLSLFGGGAEIYEKDCASCHTKILKKDYVLKHMKELKAPPMIEVIQNIKTELAIIDDEDIERKVALAFIRDYIKYPDMMGGFCSPFVYDLLGEMPSLKGKISQDDIDEVTNWIMDELYEQEF